MWEQSCLDTCDDVRVWRGGVFGTMLGCMFVEQWFCMEWLFFVRNQVDLSEEGKNRLMRMMECFHRDCGFVNCMMFRMFDVASDVVKCGVCNRIYEWFYLQEQLVGFNMENDCNSCGRWCADRRDQHMEYMSTSNACTRRRMCLKMFV